MEWLADNYGIVLAVIMLAEKLVKLSPTKYDDIILDMVWSGIKKALKKNDPQISIKVDLAESYGSCCQGVQAR